MATLQPRQWEVLDIASNTAYGPYTGEEMVGFVSAGRVVAESMVRHPVETLGAWMPARATELLSHRFAATTKTIEPEANGVQFERPRERAGVPPRTKLQPRGSRGSGLFLVDFLDPSFRYYVTPTIVSISWILFLVFLVAGFMSLAMSEIPIQERPVTPPLEYEWPRPVRYVVGAAILALWMRVFLESIIVLFHISNSLKSIDELSRKKLT